MTKDVCVNPEKYVVMSNDLIKSKSNLSLNEIKLLRLTIMQIVAEDTELMTYKVPIKELGELFKISPKNLYRDAQDMCKHLLQEIVMVGDGNPKHKWEMFQWCSRCKYEDGIITIKLHDDLKPYLLELKGYYTQYLLEDILLLKSKYAIRVYELIRESMKYQKVFADQSAEVEINIETIRTATDTESKYAQTGHFKEKVIDKAVAEINAKLGYHVTYEDVKKSRKIVGFKFKIESRNNCEE